MFIRLMTQDSGNQLLAFLVSILSKGLRSHSPLIQTVLLEEGAPHSQPRAVWTTFWPNLRIRHVSTARTLQFENVCALTGLLMVTPNGRI
jgi:hypothetical protein